MRFLTMTLLAATACLASSGGPDGGGYYWYDREESPDFFNDNWMDISSSGTYMGPGDDTYWFAGTLSFDFVYYGELSNDIYISSSGMQGDPDNGTELQYMPLICEPGDWYLLTPNADPFGTSSLERTTWAWIKSVL